LVLDQIYDENKVRPHQYEFARLNLNYTVMSKRKVIAIGAGKHCNGWNNFI
jgi:glutaminyl-tRNA synthetase